VSSHAYFTLLILTKKQKKEVIAMVDLSHKTIKHLFEQQVIDMTRKTLMEREDSFDYQLSGGWIR